MLKTIYRFATVADVPELVELRVRMQMEVNDPEGKAVTPAYRDSVRRYFSSALEDGTYVSAVATADGRVVAANGVSTYYKPPSIGGQTGLAGYVCNVYTLPEWRGKGLATELMKLVVDYAKANHFDKLHLGATESGKSVYERVGFRDVRFAAMELKL